MQSVGIYALGLLFVVVIVRQLGVDIRKYLRRRKG